MKTIHRINQIATLLTIALYFMLIPGMYAQLILGPLQLLLAGIITYKYQKKLDNQILKALIRYWIASASALALVVVSVYYFEFLTWIVLFPLFVLPMAIAIYFLILTANINANFKNLRHELQPPSL